MNSYLFTGRFVSVVTPSAILDAPIYQAGRRAEVGNFVFSTPLAGSFEPQGYDNRVVFSTLAFA